MLSNPVLRRLVLLGTPLVTAILMLFHPVPYEDITGKLIPTASWWTALHTIQFVLFAFMGAAVWLLTEGLRGVAATTSKVAAVVFALFYDIGDAVAGISTGILARSAANLPAAEQAAVAGAVEILFRDPTKNLFFSVGIFAWIVALTAAAVALFWAGVPPAPLFLLPLPVFFMSFDHAFPFGSLTFGSFFLAALWLELARRKRAPGEGDKYAAVAHASETSSR
jgi:lysylphosphatidylglycerol synthetase-like protein (DUF2156 family)